MNKSYIKLVVLFSLALSVIGCGILFPHEANLYGVNSEGIVDYRNKNLMSFKRFHFSVGLNEIQRVSDNEDVMFSQLKILINNELKINSLCEHGFELIRGSLRDFEGGLIAVELRCL